MPESYYDLRYDDVPIEKETDLAHTAWMCKQAIEFIDEGRVGKAMRWLGWINCTMWRCNILTPNEIKKICTSDSNDDIVNQDIQSLKDALERIKKLETSIQLLKFKQNKVPMLDHDPPKDPERLLRENQDLRAALKRIGEWEK